MPYNNLKTEIEQLDQKWHKLIFLCNRNKQFNTTLPMIDNFIKVNVNYIVSEGLQNINHNSYPLYIEDVLRVALCDSKKVHFLKHIDILFDPSLRINPIRLLENISKEYKLVVEWPGTYECNNLIYAEHGHPEFFVCYDFEGRVIIK